MKKMSLFLVAIIIFCIPVSAYTAEDERILTNRVTFSIDNGTANCHVNVLSDSSDTAVTVQLWDGSRCLYSWSESDKSTIIINKSVPVRKGRTYTLTVDITVDGVAKDQVRRTAKS